MSKISNNLLKAAGFRKDSITGLFYYESKWPNTVHFLNFEHTKHMVCLNKKAIFDQLVKEKRAWLIADKKNYSMSVVSMETLMEKITKIELSS